MTETTEQPAATCSHPVLLRWVTIVIVFLGVISRFVAWEKVERHYFDEHFYKMYAEFHTKHSLADFAKFCDQFIKLQTNEPAGIPPPTRLAYPYAGAVLSNMTDMSVAHSLTTLSAIASALMLVIAAIWAWRMFPPGIATMVTALMAVSLNQLHLSQRIMIDPVIGVLTLAALWSLWEMSYKPENQRKFIAVYVLSLAVLVMVKENAFFIYVAIGTLLLTKKYTKVLPGLPPNLLVITIGTGALSFCTLVFLSGGFEKFIKLYRLLVERSLATPYVHEFGDGPWYHYIVDSMLAQPLPTFLAIAAVFWAPFENARVRYLTFFSLVTFAIMSQVKYGVFYRYGIIWDFPVAVLASFQLRKFADRVVPVRTALALAIAIVLICAAQIHSFWRIGVVAKGYALTTYDLMTALKFYNPPPKPRPQPPVPGQGQQQLQAPSANTQQPPAPPAEAPKPAPEAQPIQPQPDQPKPERAQPPVEGQKPQTPRDP